MPGARHAMVGEAVHALRRLSDTLMRPQHLEHAPGRLHQFTLSENTDVSKEPLTLHPAELGEANPKNFLLSRFPGFRFP